jgi:hypothetical protein
MLLGERDLETEKEVKVIKEREITRMRIWGAGVGTSARESQRHVWNQGLGTYCLVQLHERFCGKVVLTLSSL